MLRPAAAGLAEAAAEAAGLADTAPDAAAEGLAGAAEAGAEDGEAAGAVPPQPASRNAPASRNDRLLRIDEPSPCVDRCCRSPLNLSRTARPSKGKKRHAFCTLTHPGLPPDYVIPGLQPIDNDVPRPARGRAAHHPRRPQGRGDRPRRSGAEVPYFASSSLTARSSGAGSMKSAGFLPWPPGNSGSSVWMPSMVAWADWPSRSSASCTRRPAPPDRSPWSAPTESSWPPRDSPERIELPARRP